MTVATPTRSGPCSGPTGMRVAGIGPLVDAAARLSSREACHLESEGRLLKRRLLRSFSRDGQRYKVRGYVVDKEGALLVTSRRVALIHEGVSSFPPGKILDVEVDQDRQLLVLTATASPRRRT